MSAFFRLTVDHAVHRQPAVGWHLQPTFRDPQPYIFQLQRADDGQVVNWQNVSDPANNVSFLRDGTPSAIYSKLWNSAYRVQLTTPGGVQYSEPVGILSQLNRRDWLIVRELVRQRRLHFQKFTGWPGWILKRRTSDAPQAPTAPAAVATDPLTGDIVSTKLPDYAGTDVFGGFFAAYPVDFYPAALSGWHPRRDLNRGPIDPTVRQFLSTDFPYVEHGDVFVHQGSDRRFTVRDVTVVEEHRGQPVTVQVGLTQLPASDIVYEVAVP